jgi:hypothetical protein
MVDQPTAPGYSPIVKKDKAIPGKFGQALAEGFLAAGSFVLKPQ